MDISEFIDTYSDDVIYLFEGRSALLTHPLRTESKDYLDASICRLLAVFMIGSIEVMLEAWRDRDLIGILDAYFGPGSNSARVSGLYEAFTNSGIQVDRQVFDDYLAIKYLRNTIVHGRWKENEKEWLDSRGFPTDSRKLTKEHLDKIEHVNQNMMLYIFLTSHTATDATKPDKLIKLGEHLTRRPDETGILRFGDIDQIIWNNLERIDARIYVDIEKTVLTEQYAWTEGRSRADLEQLGEAELKRLFYLAARRAGEDNYEPLTQHRALAKEALEFWHDYWQRAVVSNGLNDDRIKRSLQVLGSPYFDPEIPIWSLIGNMSDEVAGELVGRVRADDNPFTSEEMIDAIRAGNLAYRLIPNLTPVTLFSVRLPVVDPENTPTYFLEGERALNIFRLNRSWYSCVEHRQAFTDETLNLYSRMQQEFSQRR